MNIVAKRFFLTAVVYGVLGMLLGLQMGITHDHGQMPTHAHIMVIGWLSFFVFGFFYHQFDAAISKQLAAIHFWLAQLSFIVLVMGLWLVYSGRDTAEPILAISSMVYALSFVVFGIVVFKSMSSQK